MIVAVAWILDCLAVARFNDIVNANPGDPWWAGRTRFQCTAYFIISIPFLFRTVFYALVFEPILHEPLESVTLLFSIMALYLSSVFGIIYTRSFRLFIMSSAVAHLFSDGAERLSVRWSGGALILGTISLVINLFIGVSSAQNTDNAISNLLRLSHQLEQNQSRDKTCIGALRDALLTAIQLTA